MIKKLPWIEPDGCNGIHAIHINALKPLSWYGFSNNYLYKFERTQKDVERLAFRIQSMIAFCDATYLKPAAPTCSLRYDEGFDHTRFWRTPDRRLLITTEPYRIDKAIKACQTRGWGGFVFAPGIGLCEGASSGTRLILISPDGLPLEPFVSALTHAMPAYAFRADKVNATGALQ